MFLDVLRNLIAQGIVNKRTCFIIGIPVQPGEMPSLASERIADGFHCLRLFTHGNLVTRAEGIGRDIYHFAIHRDMLMRYQLAGSSSAGCYTESENGIVQARFQVTKQVFTGDTLLAGCFMKQVFELPFQQTVSVFSLLLFGHCTAYSDCLDLFLDCPC
jgi:hypothetical protein